MGLQLVTGGAGFIGSHLADRLLAEGHTVRVVDDLSSGREENLAASRDHPGLTLIRGDITDPDLARRAVAGVENVFHQAAIPSVPRSVDDPEASHHANATGTLRLLLEARDAGVKRFIYASSSSVYGDTPVLPKVESMPVQPLSPYAISKLAAEAYAQAFHRLYGLPTVGLRYFNVFGPRQDPESQYAAVVPRFVTAIAAGRPPVVFGDGQQTRDFTYVDNAVEANVRASLCGPEAFGGTFNVACGERTSLLDLVNRINAIMGTRCAPRHDPPRPGDVRDSLADISAARDLLGYRPRVGLDEGLARTVAWFTRTPE